MSLVNVVLVDINAYNLTAQVTRSPQELAGPAPEIQDRELIPGCSLPASEQTANASEFQ